MTNRAILITGASRGIGRATAEAFAALGDRVAVHHRDSAALAEKVRASLPGDGHVVVQADLADPAAVRAMVDAAAQALGGLDVLVDNAGIYQSHPITEVSYEEWQAAWQATLGVNLIGAANATWCAVQHMKPGGRIVNVSSRGAFAVSRASPPTGRARPGSTPWASPWPRRSGRAASRWAPWRRASWRPTWPPSGWPRRTAT